jgi:hypothetical protein
VRTLLWDNGSGPVFPAEILVDDTADGVKVSGHNGFPLPAVSVSLAHAHELGVSIARFGDHQVTIAIEDPDGAPDGRNRAAVSNPADLPARQYVVAWTAGPVDQEEQ